MFGLLFLVAGGVLAARWYGNSILFQRTRVDQYDPDEFPLKFKNGVSYIYDRPEAKTVVIFSHGSGGNLTNRHLVRDFFAGTDYGLILYDYYGYGASQEVPTLLMNETALTRAAEEIIELTRGKQLILMGASLGSHPTCWLAAQQPINLRGVILCVPFDTIGSIVKVAPYFLGSYDNVSLCQKIRVPTLLVRAEYDQLIPASCCDRLLEALGKSGRLITIPTQHQNYLTDDLKKRILEFIQAGSSE